jgi:carboxymethylenebutenolidase
MGELIDLRAVDGHKLQAYVAAPQAEPRGGLVMIQEIFGMTEQMRRCADRYADAGFLVILPAMFDRVERGLVVGYTEFQRGGKAASSIDDDAVLADVEAARAAVSSAGRSAIMGYCWGGTVAYMAACQPGFDCAVSYYGGGVGRLAARMQPQVPVQYHFGADDSFIPPATIGAIRAADPHGEFYVYDGAGHGFNCDDRTGFHPAASALSEQRVLAFLGRHLAG